MTSLTTHPPAGLTGVPRQVTLLLATILTVVMNYLSNALPLFGNSNQEVSDSLPNAFVPAGLTFAIWGLIFLGLLTFAVYQALPAQRTARYDALFWPYLLSNLLNVAWLLAFQSLNIGLSVLVMLALLLSLIWLYFAVRAMSPQGSEVWTVQVPVSLYLGWISVATIANITAFLVSVGIRDSLLGLSGPVWSFVLLIVAAVIGVRFLLLYRDVTFALVLLWAFYGVYAARPDVAPVPAGVLLGAVLLVVGMVLAFARRRTP